MDEATLFDLVLGLTSHNQWKIIILVRCTVSQTGPVSDDGIVKQSGTVCIFEFLHSRQQIGVLLHVKNVNLLQFLVAIALLIVSHVVMLDRIGKYSLIQKRGIPAFRPDHESADIGNSHLQRQQHQVCLQADVFATRQNLILGHFDIGFRYHFLHFLDPDFDITNHLHEFSHRFTVTTAQFS